ncbi:hypothetical protein F5X99DRAFT_413991 [Biscogniauxia marginata]|nr:hypothetical protein F5X99DRAFT_413991 [Biscogniauxia marginata]
MLGVASRKCRFVACWFTTVSAVCREIGLENFASLNLQSEIDKVADDLANLGLECGYLPLKTLLEKENGLKRGRSLSKKDGTFLIRLAPSGASGHGSNQCFKSTTPVRNQQDAMDILMEAAQTADAGDFSTGLSSQEENGAGGIAGEWLDWVQLNEFGADFNHVLDTDVYDMTSP